MGAVHPPSFAMVQRVTLRTRKSYSTKSNGNRIVKTPGGKLRYLTVKMAASAPKCGDCHRPPRWPCPPPAPVRADLEEAEDRPARVRWLALRDLRPRPHCPRVPGRGGQDRQARYCPADQGRQEVNGLRALLCGGCCWLSGLGRLRASTGRC